MYGRERISVSKLTKATYISTENMHPNKAGFTEAASLPTTDYATAFDKGDVLVSNIRPYFKKIVYCDFIGGCSSDVLCFHPTNGVPSSYLFSVLHRDFFFEYMVVGSKGTKMPRGDKVQIMQYPVSIPSDEVYHKFDCIVCPILHAVAANKAENTRLATLRDTLLPRLMTGEMSVADLAAK
jgi:type I restriction enzyme S subunit